MGIVVEKIEFLNYRQYGTGSLSFNSSDGNMLSVMIAKNGTGKTTMLNAITWCLYGKELHLANDKTALPLANTALVRSVAEGTFLPVAVKITITDDTNVVEFNRTVTVKTSKTAKGAPHVIPGTSKLTVTITPLGDFKNTVVKEGVDADVVVKQYFDEAIYKFYFFDGEKLREYFSVGQSATIKQSIYNISQVTMLENACNRLSKMHTDRTKKIGKGCPDIATLSADRDKIVKRQNTAQDTLDDNNAEIIRLDGELRRLDEILRGYDPVKNLQTERQKLEATLKKLDADEAQYHSDRSAFIRQYMVLLALYPRIKKTLEIIHSKEDAGDLPPAIDKDQVRKLLDHLDQPCPLCNHEIGESGRDHLEKLLQMISVSSRTSNYLKEIKAPLEAYLEKAKQYKVGRDQLRQRAIDLEAQKAATSTRLQEITSALSGFETDDGGINVAKLEQERTSVIQSINAAHKAVGVAETTIETCKQQLKKIDADLASALKKLKDFDDVRKQLAVIDSVNGHFRMINNKLMAEMRAEIEAITWKFFDSMIWKKNTFGSISISESYDISVRNTDGVEMTGSLSATEQMALAYAFTLAIHQASGKNCPLVIDSPLGRVSDENRESMAKALLEVSKDKQIIMLFTPDEYSEAVRALYDENAEVRDLTLSADESYVEGIDR